MSAVLASQSCYFRKMDLQHHRIALDDFSFSRSMSSKRFPQFDRYVSNLSASFKGFIFQVEMRKTREPAECVSNGQPSKMVPASEFTRRTRNPSVNKAGTVNGTKQNINVESKVVNGVSIVKRETSPPLIRRLTVLEDEGLPPFDEPRVLPTDVGFSWASDNYNSVQRSIDVWSFVISLRVRILLDNAKWAYAGGFSEEKQKKRRKKTAAWLRECVLQLGPTFIKLGQLSSTRSDLFPREYVDELAKLQDRVPAFSPKKARDFIEKELGAPVDVLFKLFEDQPIAAASLGQVHRAILHNGEKVIVKVQRPGLKRLFDIDLRNLKLIAEYFQNSESLGGPTRDWVGIYEECAIILYQEIDYINEGKNADRFRRDFRNVKWARVPLVYWDYTASKVLTLEYVPGIKINELDKLDAQGFNRSQIASRAIEAYLIQILKTGFFHADPHPGNLAIDRDEAIIYYDFGMMGEIKTFTRERLLDLFYAVYEKDTKKVVVSLIDLGALQPTGDLSAVTRSVKFFLDNLLSQTPDQQQTLAAIGEVAMEVDQQEVLEQDVVEYQESENFKSPMKLMKEWIPACEGGLLPKEGLVFDNLEQCENFYKTYAHHVGFSVRKSSCKKTKDGVEKYKYYVCSKEGFMENSTNAKSKGKDKVRNRKLTREGCNALAAFKRTEDGKYVLFRFYEGHTHLLATPKKRHMLKSNARVKSVHRALFKSYTRANVGPTRAHRYMKEQVGGFEHVGCSKQALKNFQRDLKAYIKDSDAHIFVENLKRKKEVNKSFYYAYELDNEQRLKHIFWADGISRKNYALYGDVVSFDTTFDTNRYKMIFAPFTGIDNHRHCVTFGAAFLGDEKSESFIWLFDKFLEAMGNHKPICIITDQDPAMKVAIQKVFDTSTHRLCMWHIMKKLSEKVGCSLNADSDFNARFKSCVYNSETAMEFEMNWHAIIEEFGLTNNAWLSHMFVIRYMWIPAYFRDLFMGAVLRTTSRSESENNFFSNFTNPHLSLVEFWMRFESAMELQRHNQLKADNETISSLPQLKTNRDLERHAARIYTYSNFYIFQNELWVACMDCEVDDKKELEEGFLITIADNSRKHGKSRQVIYNPSNHIAHCSCKMFECEGIPCRHILCIFKAKLNELPQYYILSRWSKMAHSKPIFDVDGNVLEGCSQMNDEDKLISDNWMEFLTCMEVAGRDPELLTLTLNGISNVKKHVMELKGGTSETKIQELESFIGSSAPEQVEIHPPKQSHTKGGGKRIKGGKEEAMEKQKKKRVCHACGEEGNHDRRNCPSKLSA